MTKCRAHPYDHGAGVCAACLCERLLAVVGDREGAQSPDLHWICGYSPPPPPPPPPLEFPRSVSPYASSRRHRHQRFFSTPQVGPTFDYDRNLGGAAVTGRKKRSSVLSLLFGPGTGSRSWFLGLFPSRRPKKEKQLPDRPVRLPASGRGMSPERGNDAESVGSSCYTTDSTTVWRRPEPTPVRRFPAASPGRGVIGGFGIAMCLSPLVRPNPKLAMDMGFVGAAGDIRSGTATMCRRNRRGRRLVSMREGSLGPSRSRKLTDMGRFR